MNMARLNHTVAELKMKYDPRYRQEKVHECCGFVSGRYKATKPRTFQKDFFPIQVNRGKLFEVRKLLEENGYMDYCIWGG